MIKNKILGLLVAFFSVFISVGAVFSQTTEDTVVSYINTWNWRLTSDMNNSNSAGVHPKEYFNTKLADIYILYNLSPDTANKTIWSNAFRGTVRGQGDFNFRTTEPNWFWYTPQYTVYSWADSFKTWAHKANKLVLVSYGGIWGRDDGMMDWIFLDTERVKAKAKNDAIYARANGYDGAELDWEFPASTAKANINLYYDEFRKEWPQGILYWTTNRTPIGAMDRAEFEKHDITVMPMGYGYGGVTPHGHHAALYNSKFHPATWGESYNTSGINQWLTQGWTGKNMGWLYPFEMKSHPGDYGVASAQWASYETYQVVLNKITAGAVDRWDTAAQVPYFNYGGRHYTYDNPKSIALKVAYMKSKGVRTHGVWHQTQGFLSHPPAGHTKWELWEAFYNAVKGGTTLPPPAVNLAVSVKNATPLEATVGVTSAVNVSIIGSIPPDSSIEYLTLPSNVVIRVGKQTTSTTFQWTFVSTVSGNYKASVISYKGGASFVSNIVTFTFTTPPVVCWTKAQVDSAYNAGYSLGKTDGYNLGFTAGKASVICPTCPPAVVCDTTLWYNTGWNAYYDALAPTVSGQVSVTLPIVKPNKKP